MSRVAWLGWLCFFALFGLGCAIWVLATLSAMGEEVWPDNPLVSFTVVFLWLPACIVVLGLTTLIGALFWCFGQQATTVRGGRSRRSVPTANRERGDPNLTFTVLDDGGSQPLPSEHGKPEPIP